MIVDSHCHLDYPNLYNQLDKVIERAEKNDAEGNKIYKELKQEFMEKYMPQPDADPHGAVNFDDVKNPNYMDTSNNIRPNVNSDEMI